MKSLKREVTSIYLHFRKITGCHVEMKFKEDKRIFRENNKQSFGVVQLYQNMIGLTKG